MKRGGGASCAAGPSTMLRMVPLPIRCADGEDHPAAHCLPLHLLALLLVPAAVGAGPLAAAAGAQARGQATVLMSENPRGRELQEKWGFADAVVTGDTVYLSGVVAGAAPGETGFETAYERVYRQIGATLKRAGASWDDVVDMTSFHTDVEGQIEALAAVHKRHVKAPYPAWTAIGVSKVLGGGITEIKVVAKLPAKAAAK